MSRTKQQARIMDAALSDVPQPIRTEIDWGCIARIEAYAALRRAELGPDRWAELQKEWNA
jgi:hypothetical protein